MNQINLNDKNIVYLKCIKEKNKLRMRIISNGYITYANCQCQRDIRKENCYYSVSPSNISLKNKGNTFYYHISKPIVNIYDVNVDVDVSTLKDLKIFEVDASPDCLVCFDRKKERIMVPCGHYLLCTICLDEIMKTTRKCPYCRNNINLSIAPDQLL